MRNIWTKLLGSAERSTLRGQLYPWGMAALVTSIVPVLWVFVLGAVPVSRDGAEQTGYLLAEARTLRVSVTIVFLAVGVVLSIPPVRAMCSTSGWRARAAYLFSALAIGILCFVFPVLSTFWSLVWISEAMPPRRPFLWAFFGYHDPRIMILELAVSLPVNAMALAACSLLIRWSRAGVYVVVASIVSFIVLLVSYSVLVTD